MPNSILIPTAQNLPDGFCPTSWQAVIDTFAPALRVTLPTSASQIIVQQNTPAAEYQDRIWFQTDANNHVLGIKSFDSNTGQWERSDEEQYYFTDIGTTNKIQISSSVPGDNVTTLSDIIGRLLIIKVANANSAVAVTIEIDGMPATPVKKYGGTDLEVGNIESGMICMFVYDGTNFQFLNPKPTIPAGAYYVKYNESSLFAFPGPLVKTEWAHGMTAIPTFFEVSLVCVTPALGFAANDEINIWTLQSAVSGQGGTEIPVFSVSADGLKVYASSIDYVNCNMPTKLGYWASINGNDWKLKFKAYKLISS